MARFRLLHIGVALAAACGHPASQSDAAVDADAMVDGSPPRDAPIIDPGEPVCTPPPPPPTLPVASPAAGSRLIPRVLAEQASGGVEVPYGAYDSLLGVHCDPVHYADMTVRCVPRKSELHLLSDRLWADAAKTIPISLEPLDQPPPQGTLVGFYGEGVGCWPISVELARIGAARQETVYFDSLAGSKPVPSGYGLFDLTPVPSDFVELTPQLAQFSGAIGVRELHGSDGSRLFATELYDTTHDVPVEVVDTTTEHRLLPPATRLLRAYRQFPPTNQCGLQGTVYDLLFSPLTWNNCDASALRYLSGGGPVYQVALQYGTIWVCPVGEEPGIKQVTTTFFGVCGTVPFSEWTPVSRITIGGGRLTTAAYSIGGATYTNIPGRWSFNDATLGMSCSPQLATDNVLRCLPVINVGQVMYSDSACTSRAIISSSSTAPVYAEQGSIVPLPIALHEPVGTVTVYTVGALQSPGTIYARTSLGCKLVYSSSPWYDVGGEVPASTFAAMSLRDVP